MDVVYFHARRRGPEAVIENALANRVPDLFPSKNGLLWIAGSLQVGAGMPDLIVASCEPQVSVLCQVDMPTAGILAYLRAVGRAQPDTISKRMRLAREIVIHCLHELVEIEVVSRKVNTFSLSPIWREILPEVVAIEAKVKNWKSAVQQAARNHIFAHRSFVALPDQVAQRVQLEPTLRQLGIGLLSVGDDNTVSVLRRSRRRQPRVWTYYYEIASRVARHFQDTNNALQDTTPTG